MQWKQKDQIYKQIYKMWQICKKIYTENAWWIYIAIYRATDHKYTALKLRIDHQMRNTVRDHPDVLKRNYGGQFI